MYVRTVRKCVVFVVSFQMLGTRLNQFDRSTSCKTSWWNATSQCPACMLILTRKSAIWWCAARWRYELIMSYPQAFWKLITSYHISRKFQAVAAECATGIHRACGSKARASNPEALQENNVQAEQYSECLCVQVPHSYRCIGCDSRHVFA